MLYPTGEAKKVVLFYNNMLLRKSNATHTITYNSGDQSATLLVCHENDVSKHQIVV